MGNNAQQTAPASEEVKILAENQPQTPLPREYEKRFESDKELKTFLDEKEILARIPISRRTLFNWRAAGKIPTVSIGRRNLFHWPSVEQALLRRQRGGAE
jgi:hypothetical protein